MKECGKVGEYYDNLRLLVIDTVFCISSVFSKDKLTKDVEQGEL